MRIVLQQKNTELYFRDIGAWTQDSSEAMDFLSSTAAIDFCVQNQLNGLQLVLKFDEQKYEIVLPFAAGREAHHSPGQRASDYS